MKKFFSVMPLQRPEFLKKFEYLPTGNSALYMAEGTRFPILTVVNAYVARGEEFRFIVVMTENDFCRANCETLKEDLAELCAKKGVVCPRGVEVVTVQEDESVTAHVATFQRLIDFAEDDDEIFACMTFGTKPLSTALIMAVQYAYRIKKNASISCVVYGQITRSEQGEKAHIYDMTALIQLDEIVRVLAEQGVADPKRVIDGILAL